MVDDGEATSGGRLTRPEGDELGRQVILCAQEGIVVVDRDQRITEILASIDFGAPVADIVRSHHERLDGSGYPDGLSGSAIPIEARMIAVADVVEAMSSHRPYRPAMGPEPALAEIAQGAGRLYDPDSVTACARVFAEGFALSE